MQQLPCSAHLLLQRRYHEHDNQPQYSYYTHDGNMAAHATFLIFLPHVVNKSMRLLMMGQLPFNIALCDEYIHGCMHVCMYPCMYCRNGAHSIAPCCLLSAHKTFVHPNVIKQYLQHSQQYTQYTMERLSSVHWGAVALHRRR